MYQKRGNCFRYLDPKVRIRTLPSAILFKKLDEVAAEWLPCLRVVKAVSMLTEKATKLTLRQKLEVLTPHQVK